MSSKLLIVMTAVTVAINAQTPAPNTTSDVVDGPSATPVLTPCMTECFTAVAAADGCGTFVNITCVCTSAQFQVDTNLCLLDNCTPTDAQAALTLLNSECVAAGLSATGAATPTTIPFTLPGVSSTTTGTSATVTTLSVSSPVSTTSVLTPASSSNHSAETIVASPANSTSSSSPTSTTSSDESTSQAVKLAIIFGSILGVLGFLIILFALWWYLFRYRKKTRTQPSAIDEPPVFSAESMYHSNPIHSFQPNAMNTEGNWHRPQTTNLIPNRYEPSHRLSTSTEGWTPQMSKGGVGNPALLHTIHQPTAPGSDSVFSRQRPQH